MSEPTSTGVDPNAGRVSLSAEAMAELFPDSPPATPQTPQIPVPQAPAAPQAPAPDEPFLKAGDSVYNSREAAEEGTRQKDALIAQLRQQYALTTGIDPISRQPIVANSPQATDNYQLNPKKYFEDLQKSKTPEDLAQVQQKFVMDTIQPYVPSIASVTRTQARQQVEAEIPDFTNFYGTPDFRKTLETTPSLKEAIETAEGDVRFHTRLPDLYKTAYLVNKGIQLPELLKKQAAPQNPSQTPTTNLPTTVAPTETSAPQRPSLTTSAGRKAIIDQFEKGSKESAIDRSWGSW